MSDHKIGTREEWQAARDELAKLESELAERNEEIKKKRLELPWVPVEKAYEFDTEDGKKTLAELFDGRSQLLVYHLMFGTGFRVTNEGEACTGCSFVADHFDASVPHLNGHDVTLVAASLGPLELQQAYKRRMGWKFPWVASPDFNYDFDAAFTPEQQESGAEYNFRHYDEIGSQREGVSAFALEDGTVYHTYSAYSRGVETLMGTYRYLDIAPLGRNEDQLPHPAAWWYRHDEYPPN